MLTICVGIAKFNDFKKTFQNTHKDDTWVDLSNIATDSLLEQCDAILSHHKKSAVFLGYLEPGWMLEPTHQTCIRELIRKFPVGFVCEFKESIPFSWKNEIDVLYMERV